MSECTLEYKSCNELLPEQRMCNVWYFQVRSLEDCVGELRADKRGQMQRWILGCGLIIHLAMRPLTRHIKWKGNRKRRTSVYQTELDYLVYSITSQGLIDNTERCCRNHSIIGNRARSWSCRQCVFLCVQVVYASLFSYILFLQSLSVLSLVYWYDN